MSMVKITIALLIHLLFAIFLVELSLLEIKAQSIGSGPPGKYYAPEILESVELPVRDADGIALGDITVMGKLKFSFQIQVRM